MEAQMRSESPQIDKKRVTKKGKKETHFLVKSSNVRPTSENGKLGGWVVINWIFQETRYFASPHPHNLTSG